MAQYATLKASIQNVIKQNGNNEITGDLLQQALMSMINSLGVGYQYAGIATPATNPGTPDQNVFYIAGAGSYPNFGNTVVPNGSIGCFRYNGDWSYQVATIADYSNDFLTVYRRMTGYEFTLNGFIYNSDGIFESNNGYRATDFIEILGTDIAVLGVLVGPTPTVLAFYNSNKEFISAGYNNTTQAVVEKSNIPANAKYIRCCTNVSEINTASIVQGNFSDIYERISNFNQLVDDISTIISTILTWNIPFDKNGFISTSGGVIENSNYRTTLKRPIFGYTTLKYRGSISTQPLVAFFDSNGNIITSLSIIGSGTGEGEIDLTQPQYNNVYYIAVSNDTRGTTNYYAILKTANSVDVLTRFTENESSITENKQEIKTVINGNVTPFSQPGYINLSGGISSNDDYRHTDYLRLSFDETLTVKGIFVGSSSLGLAFYDADKNFISGYNSITNITVQIADFPANAVYFRCGTRVTQGELLTAEIINTSLFSLSQKQVVSGSQDVLLPVFNKLKVLAFGDSISAGTSLTIVDDKTTAYQYHNNSYVNGQGVTISFKMWPQMVNEILRCADLRCYAFPGAEYKFAARQSGNELQNLKYQIDVAFNDLNNPNGIFPTPGAFIPDVIIFALGTNDGAPNDTYDSAMAKTIMNQANTAVDVDATLANLDLTKFNEAVRYAFLRVKRQFPYAIVLCVLPIQRANGNNTNLTTLHDALMKMANTYSIIVIDGAFTLGVIRDLETVSGLGACLKDGLHPNEKGQNMLTRMIANGIKQNYIDLQSMN